MSDGPNWATIVGVAVTAGAAIITAVLWFPTKLAEVYKAIQDSRHKAASDLVPKWGSFEKDIERLQNQLDSHQRQINALTTKVAVLAVRQQKQPPGR